MFDLPVLYPHQESHKDSVRTALARHGRVILQASPGVGKTIISKWILGSSLNRTTNERQSGRSLFTVHRRGLIDNADASFNEDPALPHGIIMSGRETSYGSRLQVASIDTLLNWFIESGKWNTDITFDLCIIDECHSHLSKFRTMLDAHDAKRKELGLVDTFVIGLTATPQCNGLGDVFRDIVSGPTTEWLIENKYLSPFRYFRGTQGHLEKLVKRGVEFTKDSVCDAMDGMSGDLVRDWMQYAQGRATVGFFPRLSQAREASVLLKSAGVEVDYVDGSTPDDERRAMFRALNNGIIDYICNVGVVERGTDIPRIGCVQLCVAIGSVARYRQMIGRGSRIHPAKQDCCVARDTPILTDRGLVPIQDVTLTDMVWDGVEFCSHDGPFCKGIADVINFNGLLITPEHKVLTSHGWKAAKEAEIGRLRPVIGGTGRMPIRTSDDSNPYNSRNWPEVGSRSRLFLVWQKGMEKLSQNITTNASWVRTLYAKVRATLPGMAMENSSAPTSKMSMRTKRTLSSLRWTWNRVSVFINIRRGMLDCGKSRVAYGQVIEHRPHKQQRTLRTRQLAMVDTRDAVAKSRLCVACSPTSEVPVCDVLRFEPVATQKKRIEPEADSHPMAVEVWDIRNSGRRNRYCANGLIIANCILDHGGNIKRHGFFEDEIEWTLDNTTKEPVEAGTRPKMDCPRCRATYRGGKCNACGYEPTAKERKAEGLWFDGTELQEIKRAKREHKPKKRQTCEELMIGSLYAAGKSGRTWKQAIGIAKRRAEQQGTNFRVPRRIEVGGNVVEMLPWGHPDGNKCVGEIFEWTLH